MGEASLFDGLLALALLITALRAFWAKGSFEAVFSLLFFGFFMAMAWMRLSAADIALVEAAIGAGLTAAILMEVLRVSGSSSFSPYGYWVLPIGALLGGAGIFILHTLPDRAAANGAYALAQNALQSTPIGNPVTAVLLDFRGYDTLLEVGVLLLAAFAVTVLSGPITDRFEQQRTMLSFFSHHLAPIVVLVAGYLLYQGMDASGGAFQASALLAAAGVLFTLSGHPRARLEAIRTRTGLMAAGFAIFFLIGIVLALLEGHFLAYPTRWQPALIFTIELALSFSLAYALLMLYWRIAHSGQAR
jgi:multisubunit Na+/H+ antiporter MnhB subunit